MRAFAYVSTAKQFKKVKYADCTHARVVNIEILMKYQDDPKKCTAARLLKSGMARKVKNTLGNRKLVLNPYSEYILMPADRHIARVIVGIDCSWRLAEQEFGTRATKSTTTAIMDTDRRVKPSASKERRNRTTHLLQKISRRLPPLLAGNPVNYSKIGMLTTAEAISAALFIMGYDVQGHKILGRFKWGHTFYDLNCNILAEYTEMTEYKDAIRIATEYKLLQ